MDFIKGLGSKISQTSQDLVSKTKEIADTTKLNGEIVTEEKNIISAYQQIGEMYFKLNSEAPEAELAEFVARVKTSMINIENLKDEIRRVKGIKLCPKCSAESGEGVDFCPKCGTKLPEIVEVENDVIEADDANPQSENTKACKLCNASIEESALFCTSCGGKVE